MFSSVALGWPPHGGVHEGVAERGPVVDGDGAVAQLDDRAVERGGHRRIALQLRRDDEHRVQRAPQALVHERAWPPSRNSTGSVVAERGLAQDAAEGLGVEERLASRLRRRGPARGPRRAARRWRAEALRLRVAGESSVRSDRSAPGIVRLAQRHSPRGPARRARGTCSRCGQPFGVIEHLGGVAVERARCCTPCDATLRAWKTSSSSL